jgi:hypothetical protein
MPRKTRLGDKPVRVPIALPEDLYEWLRRVSYERRVPMAEVVRAAVSDFRERADAGAVQLPGAEGSR